MARRPTRQGRQARQARQGRRSGVATALVAAALGVLAASGAGCLRGSESGACELLEDCLCGELVGEERGRCVDGANRAGLVLGGAFQPLPPESCEVALLQQGAECPAGDLEVRPLDPDPGRRCVHDGDCVQVDCDCGGTAAEVVAVRGCLAGRCLDARAECDRRCLAARVLRGDPCQMLRRCRCAPLLDEPDRDTDADGVRDLDACLARFDLGDPGACMAAARQESTDVLAPLPADDCADVDLFIDDRSDPAAAP